MPEPARDEPASQRSVLEILGARTGLAPKVLLPDGTSEHGPSPVVAPGSPEGRLVPQGRGNYQLLGEIARGGMGVILKGHDTDLGRDVALKVLDGELAKRPAVVQRFVEEAQIGGQLQHPGIVPVYELGLMADERPYFTMKLVKGHTLASLLQQRKSPSDERGRMLAIFEDVCQTVAYAHSKGVLHRDLKPANVMVGAFGEVQVVDWGLAKVLRRGGVADEKRAQEPMLTVIETVRSGSSSTGSDSMVGSVMGTPAYMAPEQAQGEIDLLDARADVFSLGAILCELLTGRPPYEHVEGEPIVAQAARAKLAPARARIEACDADPALRQLCLDCLMTAREARPADAAVVARSVHAFLASVEERAAKAELAAAEARVRAAEERRARRLTVALAAAVGAVVLLAGAGAWWLGRERARRAEELRVAVDEAQAESLEASRRDEPEEALAAALRAQELAAKGGADSALLARVGHFVEQARAAVGAAERERELESQDQALRARLVDLRLEQITPIGDTKKERELDAAFAAAFHDYGVDLEGDDLVPALARIRERAIAEEVALALDDWGRVRRRVHGPRSNAAENLLVLAMDLDPDPLRTRLRDAVAGGDRAVLLELAAPESLPELRPGSIFVLAAELWGDGRDDARKESARRVLDQARRLYPGDYVLQAAAGAYAQDAGLLETALSANTAALSLRPDHLRIRVELARTQWNLGHHAAALATLRPCLAAQPPDTDAWYIAGVARMQLGDFEGALECLTTAPGIEADSSLRHEIVGARFYLGQVTRDDVEREMERITQLNDLVTYLLALVDHPDLALRDPELALRTLEAWRPTFGERLWPGVAETLARVRLEDWDGAYALMCERYELPALMILTPMAYDFVRSLICSKLGRDEEARAHYRRALAAWDEETAEDPAAWANSDAARWKREAEAALAR